jgi:IS4 transposase
MTHESIQTWAIKNFGNALLFNKKKVNRLVKIGTRLAEAKGTSLARLFDSWYDTKATYNLLKQPVMTPDSIQNPHREITFQNMENWSGDVLAIEDSSEFEWNHKEPIEGLGPIGSGRDCDQGFILHSTLAVGVKQNGGLEILGLPFQQYYVRPPVQEKRKRRGKTKEVIETDLWRNVVKEKKLPAKSKVIRVCDRAADIYEVLTETKEYDCRHIIRLKHDRTVLSEGFQIKSLMNNLESMGQTQIEKRIKDGTKSEIIKLNFNWKTVELKAPERPGGKLPCLKETVVHVWGESENGEKIEWFLYTDLEVNSLEDTIKIVQYYNLRWTIEIYHKILKTGLKAENLQLETAHAIFAAISIMSIVGLRVLDLRERLRLNPEAPATESGLDELELKVLGKYLKRDLKTVKCVALAIGRLGGHQNRKSDGMPGVLSLWWGMSRFFGIMEGVRLMTN